MTAITAKQIVLASPRELIPYARNSRTHSDAQIAQIAASIKEWGFTTPVLVDADNGVIAGHGRLLAAQLLDMDEVPTICCDGWTEAQKRAYVIADNKLSINAGWDDEILRIEFEELTNVDFNLGLIGFSLNEIEEITTGSDFLPGAEDEQGKLDELDPKYCICPECGEEFDLRQHG